MKVALVRMPEPVSWQDTPPAPVPAGDDKAGSRVTAH
jgi:hypothetical protein